MTSFFPETNKYMQNTDYFKPGRIATGDEAKIRILSTPIQGWENWSEDNKPVRFYPSQKPRVLPNPKNPLRQFTAMVIWNYDLSMVQVWSFHQAHLKNALMSLDQAKGSPLNYDLFISKNGEGKDARFVMRASKPSKLDSNIQMALELTPVNLYALYVGKDPFKDLDVGKEVPNESSVA